MRRFLIILLFTSCATKTALPAKPVVQLPQAAIEAMCARFGAEGMTSDVRVVKETQSLATPASLRALAEMAFQSGTPKAALIQAIVKTPLIPVEVPAKSCISRFVSAVEAARMFDVMILQFSSPFANPFGRGQIGTLARLSLGGESATWYWVPLVNQNDRWFAGTPVSLSVVE